MVNKKRKRRSEQKYVVNKTLLAVLLLMGVLLTQVVIFGIDAEPWFDVSFSLETVHLMQEGKNIEWSAYDVHFPGYYVVLYGWQNVRPEGITEYVWARELSVLFYLLFIFVAFIALGKLFGVPGEVATVLLALSTTYLHYGTEARMYIVVLLLSAIALYGVVTRRTWVVSVPLLLMPAFHYLAAMAIPVFAVMHYVANNVKKHTAREKRLLWSVPLIAGMMGVALVLPVALLQRARTTGTWFQAPAISSFPSSLFYSFFVVKNSFEDVTPVSAIIYGLFVLALAVLVVQTVRWMLRTKRVWTRKEKMAVLMGATGLAPLAALVVLSFGQGGFWNLYHHRFFLVITWMFAVICFVMLVTWLQKQRMVKVIAVGVVLLAAFMVMYWQYEATANHELQNMMDATPCPTKGNAVLIGHESPFSSLPYEVYAREKGCKWNNFISTNIDRMTANGGGFDAIWGTQSVYWNMTLPSEEFLYVQSLSKRFPLGNRSQTVLAKDDGIWLLYIDEQASVVVQFQ